MILVLGSNGQLGTDITKTLDLNKEKYFCLDREKLDVSDLKSLDILQSYEFDYPNLRMSFNTQVGSQYIIEGTDNVTALGWETVGFEEGTGDFLTIELDVTLNQEAYFRVKQVIGSNESTQSVR